MSGHTATPLKDLALGVAMPEAPPSPLPWAISEQGYIVAECIPVRGRAVAIRAQDKRHGMQDEADANAAFIVTACNSHADLVKALEEIARQHIGDEIEEDASDSADFEGAYTSLVKCARAALATLTARKVG